MKASLIFGTSVLVVADFPWEEMITKGLDDLTEQELTDVKNGIKYMFTKNESAMRTIAETYATSLTFKMVMEGKDPKTEPFDVSAGSIRAWYEAETDIAFGDYVSPDNIEDRVELNKVLGELSEPTDEVQKDNRLPEELDF